MQRGLDEVQGGIFRDICRGALSWLESWHLRGPVIEMLGELYKNSHVSGSFATCFAGWFVLYQGMIGSGLSTS